MLSIALLVTAVAFVCFLLAGIIAAITDKGLGSSDAAAWMQVLGATAALTIAIGVPYYQHHRSEKARDLQAIRDKLALCTILHDELKIFSDFYSGAQFIDLLQDAPDRFFAVEIPQTGKSHPIFDAMISRLSQIDDTKLRRGLIQTYGSHDVIWDMLDLNTRTLEKYIERKRIAESEEARGIVNPANKSELKFLREQLIDLRAQMRLAASYSANNVSLALTGLNLQITSLQEKENAFNGKVRFEL